MLLNLNWREYPGRHAQCSGVFLYTASPLALKVCTRENIKNFLIQYNGGVLAACKEKEKIRNKGHIDCHV